MSNALIKIDNKKNGGIIMLGDNTNCKNTGRSRQVDLFPNCVVKKPLNTGVKDNHEIISNFI